MTRNIDDILKSIKPEEQSKVQEMRAQLARWTGKNSELYTYWRMERIPLRLIYAAAGVTSIPWVRLVEVAFNLPKDLVTEFAKRVPARQRSRYVAEALAAKLGNASNN